jgi:hypothetical protein
MKASSIPNQYFLANLNNLNVVFMKGQFTLSTNMVFLSLSGFQPIASTQHQQDRRERSGSDPIFHLFSGQLLCSETGVSIRKEPFPKEL